MPTATDFPLDPLMAKALLLYAQTDSQYTEVRPTDADARVLELFRRQQMWVGIRLHWEPQGSMELSGSYTITRLNAKVVTRLDLL